MTVRTYQIILACVIMACSAKADLPNRRYAGCERVAVKVDIKAHGVTDKFLSNSVGSMITSLIARDLAHQHIIVSRLTDETDVNNTIIIDVLVSLISSDPLMPQSWQSYAGAHVHVAWANGVTLKWYPVALVISDHSKITEQVSVGIMSSLNRVMIGISLSRR